MLREFRRTYEPSEPCYDPNHVEDLALPKSLKSGNFILAKAILWCMGKNPA
jgi:hypothetical protein